MFKGLLATLSREYRAHRMARFTVWAWACGAALWSVNLLLGGVLGPLGALFWVPAIASGLYYLGRLFGFVRRRLLWRLRRRLIVTYIFVAIVPIVLIVFLVGLGAFIVNGQFAAFLVSSRLRERSHELQEVNRVLAHEAGSDSSLAAEPALDRLQSSLLKGLEHRAVSYPGLEISFRLGSKGRAFRLDGTEIRPPVSIPAWLAGEEFSGIVMDRGRLELRAIDRTPTRAGELVTVLSQPITPALLDLVGNGIGPVVVVTTRLPASGTNPRSSQSRLSVETSEGIFDLAGSIYSKSLNLPGPANWLDFIVRGASSLEPVSWQSDLERKPAAPVFVYVSSRVMTLNSRLLETLGEYSRVYVFVFRAVAVIFLVIEGFALIISIRLTRSVTYTVDNLYDATKRVKKGDLSHRIKIPSSDQLSALGEAFDSMTASVERLLRESEEKLRMESELEIAREVQTQLFPTSAPEVPGLVLHGVCKAARSVSGDYYDFLKLGENQVCLVLGDVSGKGISAALLVAAIQSALRAHFYNGFVSPVGSRSVLLSTSDIVRRLNLQLYENTPREKYVTFFFGIYDAVTRTLTYTNAGHLPPMLLRGRTVQRLKTGGTVVGLFPAMNYEQEEVQIEPGDLLVAFTDGITEPENTFGEQFGEDRMLEIVLRARNAEPEVLVEEIYQGVSDWTGSPELQDDMTLVVAKASR